MEFLDVILPQIQILLGGTIVYGVTALVKRMQLLEGLKARKSLLRTIVAVFSFAAALGGSLVSDQPLDPIAIQTVADAVLTFGFSSAIYLFSKK